MRVRAPHHLLTPNVLLLKAHGLWNLFRKSKNQSHYVLGDNWPVDIAGVGEYHIAVHQLGK